MIVAEIATGWLAEAPTTWEDPPPMSTLHALLLFVGGPILIIAVITLLVLAPSLAKGPRYRPGRDWDAQDAWFGDTARDNDSAKQVTSGATPGDSDDSGGASARW